MQIWPKNNVKFAWEPHKMHKMPINAEKMPIHAIVLQTIDLGISTFEECTKKD